MPWQGVASNFRTIFTALAPGGKGELVMQKRLRSAPDGYAADVDGEAVLEKYSGVAVKVLSWRF